MSPRIRELSRRLIPAGALSIGILTAIGAPAIAEPSTNEKIEAKSHQLEKVVEQFNRLGEQLKTTREEITTLETKLAPLEKQATDSRAKVGEIARETYQLGNISAWNALLTGGDGKDRLTRLGSLDHLARSNQRGIQAAEQSASVFREARETLRAQLAKQEAQSKAIAAQRKGIEAEIATLNRMKQEAGQSTSTTGSSYKGPIPNISGKAGTVVKFAYNALGKPYEFAADGPGSYDCSGLTLAAWRAAGVSLPHNAEMQWNSNKIVHIGRSQLQPGDLVFYADLGHVGIYIGSSKVIHAPTFGDVVKISSVDMMRPYGYGRVKA